MSPEDEKIINEGTNLSFSDDIESCDDSTVSLDVKSDDIYDPSDSCSDNDDDVKQPANDTNNVQTTSESNNISMEVTDSQSSGDVEKDNINENDEKSNKTEDAKLPTIAKDLESNLTCPICQSIFHVPVLITPCNHTFCSETHSLRTNTL